jgi:hypothetical protein
MLLMAAPKPTLGVINCSQDRQGSPSTSASRIGIRPDVARRWIRLWFSRQRQRVIGLDSAHLQVFSAWPYCRSDLSRLWGNAWHCVQLPFLRDKQLRAKEEIRIEEEGIENMTEVYFVDGVETDFAVAPERVVVVKVRERLKRFVKNHPVIVSEPGT